MKTWSIFVHTIIIGLTCLCMATSALGAGVTTNTAATTASANNATRHGKVTWIYDGDTLQVQGTGTVRLIGIDCPEKITSDRDWKYLKMGCRSRKTLRACTAAATAMATKLCKGKQVRIQLAGDKRDKYGRTLAYVWLPDGRMLNRIMLQEGRAIVYRRFNFSHKDDFLQLENTARQQRRGMWHGVRVTKKH